MQKIAITRLGQVLLVDHMAPLGMTVNGLAENLGIPASQMRGVIGGQFSLDKKLATMLAEMFRTTPQFWLSLQDENGTEDEKEMSRMFGDIDTNISHRSRRYENRNTWIIH